MFRVFTKYGRISILKEHKKKKLRNFNSTEYKA